MKAGTPKTWWRDTGRGRARSSEARGPHQMPRSKDTALHDHADAPRAPSTKANAKGV